REWPLVSILSSAPREHTRSTIAKKCGCSIGSPPENDRYGTSLSMSSSMTANTPAASSSSRKALPGPLSSMQCRQARLHSFVICHATWSGAPRSSASAGAERPAGREVSAATPAARSVTPSAIEEPALAQLRDEGADFALDHCVATGEAVGEPRRDRMLVASHRDLPHDRRGRRVERKDLLAASLEEHTAEFFVAEFDELGQSHGDRTSGPPATTGSYFTPHITER